jgi:hypothetical protein
MAWKAKVVNIVPDQDNFKVTVNYFDSSDTELTTVLGSQTLTLSQNISQTDAVTAIKTAATGYRNSYNLIATYLGSVINVP